MIAWEPVPLFRAYVHYNLQRNNVTHLVQLRDKVVGPEDKQKLEMMVGAGCRGKMWWGNSASNRSGGATGQAEIGNDGGREGRGRGRWGSSQVGAAVG